MNPLFFFKIKLLTYGFILFLTSYQADTCGVRGINDIFITMANIFDKCFYEDTIAVVPLSDLAFAVFRVSGNIEIFFQNTGNERSEMTAQEQAVVEEYICKINSFTDSL